MGRLKKNVFFIKLSGLLGETEVMDYRNILNFFAKKGDRIQVKLKSTESPHLYYTMKNKKNDVEKLELKKYDPVGVRKHALYKEKK